MTENDMTLEEAAEVVRAARRSLIQAQDQERTSRAVATEALNEFNRAAARFDAVVERMRKDAPPLHRLERKMTEEGVMAAMETEPHGDGFPGDSREDYAETREAIAEMRARDTQSISTPAFKVTVDGVPAPTDADQKCPDAGCTHGSIRAIEAMQLHGTESPQYRAAVAVIHAEKRRAVASPTDAEVEADIAAVRQWLTEAESLLQGGGWDRVYPRLGYGLVRNLLRAYDAVCRENGELKRELKQETAGYKAAVIASWEDKASIANQAARIKVLEDALRDACYMSDRVGAIYGKLLEAKHV